MEGEGKKVEKKEKIRKGVEREKRKINHVISFWKSKKRASTNIRGGMMEEAVEILSSVMIQ